MKKLWLGLFLVGMLAACGSPAEPAVEDVTGLQGESDALRQDAPSFADAQGISLEEAMERLTNQEGIGEIQPLLEADFPDTYAGLWIQHEPEYGVVIALTEGDISTVQPYIAGKPWEPVVEVRQVEHSLAELRAAQTAASQAAQELNIPVSTGSDIMNNRVEVMVGNPDLFQADLEAAGISLPDFVVILPNQADQPLPDTNRGVLETGTAAGDRTIYLPKQAPAADYMEALMEGTLVEEGGCLRVTSPGDEQGFLVLWPHDSQLQIEGESIEVLNGAGQPIARVGMLMRLGGGGTESSRAIERINEQIPGLSDSPCSGPYWISAPLETVEEQAKADIYQDPFSSGGRILALFIYQSRPAGGDELISGELMVDSQGCMHVGDYTILWPPNVYPREEPLRIVGDNEREIASVGDVIQIRGSEKSAQDYRFFENKIRCPAPYWGAAEVSLAE